MTPRDDAPAPLDPVPEPHTGMMGRFRNYFLTGLVVTGPIAITLYLCLLYTSDAADEL